MHNRRSFLLGGGSLALLGPTVAFSADQPVQKIEIRTNGQPLYPGAAVPSSVPALLRVPNGPGPYPAVVILHGSAGKDGRGEAMAEVLRSVGIASLELDMWTPRGLSGGTNSRPRIISDTLPDVWGAWAFLASDSRFDANRIGVLGFSWGGALAWITAFGLKPKHPTPEIQAARFAAHVPFYGACTAYLPSARGGKALAALNAKPTGAPMLYVVGSKDDYESSPDSCRELASAYPDVGMRLRMVEGATHGFDGPAYGRFYDELAKDGKGAYVTVTASPDAAQTVRREVAEFLADVLRKK